MVQLGLRAQGEGKHLSFSITLNEMQTMNDAVLISTLKGLFPLIDVDSDICCCYVLQVIRAVVLNLYFLIIACSPDFPINALC
jgi:hypothetical protein